jgi:hypothetical protein
MRRSEYNELAERMKIARKLGVGVVIVVGLIWLIDKALFQIDSCLDQGGRWDEPAKSCDFGE